MKIEQTLSSGLIIRQDIRESARFVMYETEDDKWIYATHGGTAFIVDFMGKPYGITCHHILGDFEWQQIVLTDRKIGSNFARFKSLNRPSEPGGHAEGSDILDVAVIQFSDDVDVSFFKDSAYVIDDGTIGTSAVGDSLFVYGALKDESSISETHIEPTFADLGFMDIGPSSTDIVWREAEGKFENLEIERLTGLSGSPVFNNTSGKLCGMTARGSLNGNTATIHYIDIFDIRKVLLAISDGSRIAKYTKDVKHPKFPT